MNPANFPDNKRRKQAEAKKRQAAWTLRAPEEKLRALDLRPGASKKERARIIKHVESVKTATQLTDLMIGGVAPGTLNTFTSGIGVGKSMLKEEKER